MVIATIHSKEEDTITFWSTTHQLKVTVRVPNTNGVWTNVHLDVVLPPNARAEVGFFQIGRIVATATEVWCCVRHKVGGWDAHPCEGVIPDLIWLNIPIMAPGTHESV